MSSEQNPFHMSDREAEHYASLRHDPWCDRLLEIISKYKDILEAVADIDVDEDAQF